MIFRAVLVILDCRCVSAHTHVIVQSDYVTVQLQKFPQHTAAFPFPDLSCTSKVGSDGISPFMNNVFVLKLVYCAMNPAFSISYTL